MSNPQDLRVTAIALCSIAIDWERTLDAEYPYRTTISGKRCTIRVNDFPAEPIYTLVINGLDALDLEDWPAVWTKPA
jgi:hypothetical protein